MKKLALQDAWPQSWKDSHAYDRLEIYGARGNRGYAYAYDNRRRHTLDLVRASASPPARVLDVAAAQGNFSLALAEAGYHMTWNDLREELADYVELKRDRGVVHYAPGNVFELAVQEPFDVVLITEIIEHVAHPDEFLRSVADLVKPGGHIVMTTPNGGYLLNRLPKFSECADPSQFESQQFKPNSDGHIFLLHADEVKVLAQQAGLRVDTLRLFTNPLSNGHLKTEALLHVLPRPLVGLAERATGALPLALQRKLCTGMAALLSKPL